MSRYMMTCSALVLFVLVASASAQEQAEQPVFKDGDSWQFVLSQKDTPVSTTERLTGTYELVYSEGKVNVYEVNGDQKTEVDIKPGGPGDGLAALIGKQEQRPTLKFPLLVGQKWKYEYVTRPAGSNADQQRSVEATVTGIEQVTTPAGSFKTYKLVREESWQVTRGRTVGWVTGIVTYYYSPETRSIVKSTTANNRSSATAQTELIKFTPAK